MTSECRTNVPENFTFFNVPASPKKLQDVATKELGETPEKKEQCLQEIRSLISDEQVTCITTDDFLLRFLRVKKFDVQRSFAMLKNYVHQRTIYHINLLNLQPDVMLKVFHNKVCGILPYRDSKERIICYMKSGMWNPNICSTEDLMTTVVVLGNYLYQLESTQITGIVVLFESKDWSYYDMTFFIPNMKRLVAYLWNAMPTRCLKVHFFNAPFGLKYVIRILRPIFPKKFRDAFLVHGESTEVLFQHIDSDILPSEIGGSYGPLNFDHLIEVMESCLRKTKDEQRFFIEENF